MRTRVFFAMLFLVSLVAQAEFPEKENGISNANIKWKSKTIELSDVVKGEPVQAKFVFVNEGDKPIMITKVKSSCGCTVASYEKEPVMPGEEGAVIATYNSKRSGSFRKLVTVVLCDNSTHMLVLKGNVE